MNTILSRLEDFSKDNSSSDDVFNSYQINSIRTDTVDSTLNTQLELENAYQKGYEAAVNEQKIYWERKIEDLNMANCDEIAKQKELFEVRISEYVSLSFKDSIKLILDPLENYLVCILSTILEKGIARKVAVDLVEFVDDMFKRGECGVITIHCPKNLHSIIQQSLEEYSSMILYKDSESVELSAQISGNVITTRLESLFNDVKKILD
ncbi:hypothetical protein lam_385 [Candidatus Liberibacter americanus str. Sao Paulo]|uniref:Flagellar assembly protein FliH/Type III secretion system HrpE domain-containing protein n=2 Tax=Candidatus Liberibacter americanus TaxID=309868 RepID=U6B7Q2_9HYPH|nr:hypothetical protein lam_385 [Candidatus Liberibacter americanus str. Sao Paulo]EMS36137.1 hypothetical protein G653_02791 [Candidatus Liberibacter americanus PW_SP]